MSLFAALIDLEDLFLLLNTGESTSGFTVNTEYGYSFVTAASGGKEAVLNFHTIVIII